MHNAVPLGLDMSMASSMSSCDATSTHFFTTSTFHVSMHICKGLFIKKMSNNKKARTPIMDNIYKTSSGSPKLCLSWNFKNQFITIASHVKKYNIANTEQNFILLLKTCKILNGLKFLCRNRKQQKQRKLNKNSARKLTTIWLKTRQQPMLMKLLDFYYHISTESKSERPTKERIYFKATTIDI